MSTHPVVVVGAGPTGLGCAVELARICQVTIVDRIPVAGGTAGWNGRAIRRLVRLAERSGVRFRLGATACTWEPGHLLVAQHGDISWIASDWLFFAGGLRPATPIELGLAGDRPAGVVPATVAEHLLAQAAPIWRRPAIVEGPWLAAVRRQMLRAGVTPLPLASHPRNSHAGWSITAGSDDRVCGVVANGDGQVHCDALILAGDPRPVRNVEGAIDDASPGVVFAQPNGPSTVEERSQYGRRLAHRWRQTSGESD
jgi:2-polyprenyl-6-methoxyphenol hydroxylase-like FAD-dependent oxidoreductase